MATELFPGVFVQEPDADPAPNTAFTVHDAPSGGNDITSGLTAADGITPYDPFTDAEGNVLPFRGVDGFQGPAFVDTGASIRYMLLSSTVWAWLLDNVTDLLAAPPGGGVTTYAQIEALSDYPDFIGAGSTAANARSAIGATDLAIGTSGSTAAAGNDARLSDQRTPSDNSVTNVKVAAGAAISLDKTADGTRVATTAARNTKVDGIATGATANSTDAQLRDRTTHTGAQATSTITGLDAALATIATKAALSHAHAAADITSGLLSIARLPAGVVIGIDWDDTAGGWRFNGGAILTDRPGARTDLKLYMSGGQTTDRPAWATQPGDHQDITQTA